MLRCSKQSRVSRIFKVEIFPGGAFAVRPFDQVGGGNRRHSGSSSPAGGPGSEGGAG